MGWCGRQSPQLCHWLNFLCEEENRWMQSTGTNWRWRFGLKRENPWQSFKLLQVIFCYSICLKWLRIWSWTVAMQGSTKSLQMGSDQPKHWFSIFLQARWVIMLSCHFIFCIQLWDLTMVFQSLQLNVAIHEWIRHFRIRARRVVMVIAEKKAIQSQWRQNFSQSCSIDGWIW